MSDVGWNWTLMVIPWVLIGILNYGPRVIIWVCLIPDRRKLKAVNKRLDEAELDLAIARANLKARLRRW